MNDFLTLQSNSRRIPSIDRYRGLALALMIAFGAAKMLVGVPFFEGLSTHDLSHAVLLLDGYAFYDLGAPVFIFVSGLSFGLSYLSLERRFGETKALGALAQRALKTIGVGALLILYPMDAVGIVSLVLMIAAILFVIVWMVLAAKGKQVGRTMGRIMHVFLLSMGAMLLAVAVVDNALLAAGKAVGGTHWSVLASIGVSMLVCVPLVRLSTPRKVVGAVVLTVAYWALNRLVPAAFFCHWTHGGILGALGYALLYYYALTVVELARKHRFLAYLFALTLVVAAYLSLLHVTPSKSAVNLSYVLVSFAFAYPIFLVVQLFDDVPTKPNAIFTLYGRNALLVYLIHTFITFPMGICINALIEYVGLTGFLGVLVGFVGMALYVLLMAHWLRLLQRKGFSLRL